MSSEETEQTIVVKTEGAAAGPGSAEAKGEWKGPVSGHHIHREDVKKVWKECQEESFWYRALPLSLGSMAVTGGLIYNGVWKSSKRFGPFPKLAIAGILGYAVGKASYMGTCRGKFKDLGVGREPWGEGGRPGPFGPPGHMWGKRSCNHVCEECRKKSPAAPAEQGQT